MRLALAALSVCAALFVTTSASAVLTQPNGKVIPSPPGCNGGKPTGLAATFACVCDQAGVCNIGAACPGGSTSCDDGKKANCETTLWHSVNDDSCIPSNLSGLNPSTDAAIVPETFRPACALTFTVVSRGTAMFKDIFGWYNVTGSAPQVSDLHPMLACGDPAGKAVVLDVKKDPAYKGGDIGFFLATPEDHNNKARCANGDCCASLARLPNEGYLYFSERKYNADNTSPNPFIHLLVFDSKRTARKFYFAWEDSYNGAAGDFTDLVTSVDGVECSGGGEICDTGKQGACARGVTSCASGVLKCMPTTNGGAETCNGLDDDCNGIADDNATCPADQVCVQGRCARKCDGVEFPCSTPGTSCDRASGLCLPTDCVGVTCKTGEVCRAGKCSRACDGVVCPRGQSCVADACVDLCQGVKCSPGEVCTEGVCHTGCSACGGPLCAVPAKCDDASGACVDRTCAQACAPGTHCEKGQCKDDCAGVQCPNGQVCSKSGGVARCGGTGGPFPDDGGFTNPNSVDGGLPNGNPDDAFGPRPTGCACDAAGGGGGLGATMLGAGLGLVAMLARRRRR